MVSVTIQPGTFNLAVAHAIASINPGAEVEETGGYIHISAAQQLIIDRTQIEGELDRDISIPVFHSVAFNREGEISEMTNDRIVIRATPPRSVHFALRFASLELRQRAEEAAGQLGVSINQLVNNALSAYLQQLKP